MNNKNWYNNGQHYTNIAYFQGTTIWIRLTHSTLIMTYKKKVKNGKKDWIKTTLWDFYLKIFIGISNNKYTKLILTEFKFSGLLTKVKYIHKYITSI